MTALYITIAAIIALGVLGQIIKGKAEKSKENEKEDPTLMNGFKKRNTLLSPAEMKFYELLQGITKDQYTIMAKVRMADLVEPDNGPKKQAKLNQITRKHADFVLIDPTTSAPLLVIELDDSSHERADRTQRDGLIDNIYKSSLLPCLHVKAAREYNPNEINEQIKSKLTR